MAKRRDKNHAPGPVTIIRPGDQGMPVDAVKHDEPAKPTKAAKPNKSARLLKKEAQAKRGTEAQAKIEVPQEVAAAQEIAAAQETEAPQEIEAAQEIEAPQEIAAPQEIEAPQEVAAAQEVEAQTEPQAGDVAAETPASDTFLVAAADDVPILEMDMQSTRGPEADYGKSMPMVPEVDDASGALAQAIDVDPNTVTARPKQFESIPILPPDGSTVELGEQGMAAGEAGSGIQRDWTPTSGSSERATVTFDLPDHEESEPAVAEEPDTKGRKSNRKLKLSKLQKHARGTSSPMADAEQKPATEPVRAPKPPRPQRTPAFAKLTEYQVLSLAHVPGLPEETDVPGHWRGVGFGLGGRRLVSAFDEVVEIMRMPQITHVPGTQPWMLGVANVRGTLLPVVDLKQFLEGERTVMHEGQRVLVVRQGGGNVAVLIDQLFGQRSFNDSQKAALVDDESRYGHFVKQMYRVGDSDWGVFSMSMLTRTPEFRQAAA